MAREFNGTSDVISMGDASPLKPGSGPFSVAAIVNSDVGNDGTIRGIISKTPGAVPAYILMKRADGSLRFQIAASGGTVEVTGDFLTPGRWYHIVGVRDTARTEIRIYVDGQNRQGKYQATEDIDNTAPFRVGMNDSSSFIWDGRIAEPAYWNHALSDREVKRLFEYRYEMGPLLVRRDRLKGYWPLFGFDSPEKDFSGSAIDGTLTGTLRAGHPFRDPSHVAPLRFSFYDPVEGVIREFFLKGAAAFQVATGAYIKGGAALQALTEIYLKGGATIQDPSLMRYIKGGASLEGALQRYLKGGARFAYNATYLKGGARLIVNPPLDDLPDNPPATKAGLLSRNWLSVASVKKDVT